MRILLCTLPPCSGYSVSGQEASRKVAEGAYNALVTTQCHVRVPAGPVYAEIDASTIEMMEELAPVEILLADEGEVKDAEQHDVVCRQFGFAAICQRTVRRRDGPVFLQCPPLRHQTVVKVGSNLRMSSNW